MTFGPQQFQIIETSEPEWRRLMLTGELDLASVPTLRDRLVELRDVGESVHLDLSKLEFMDSSGVQLLIEAIQESRRDGWSFSIDAELSSQVKRLFELVHVDRLLKGADGNGR